MAELSLNSLDRKITANIYTHPSSHPASMITEDTTHRWFTDAERTKLTAITSGAETNQNTFSNVKVGSNVISADSKTDTLELVAGNNVTLSANTSTQTVTINATATQYTHPSSHPGSMITEDATHRWLTDTYISNWNAKANGTHNHEGTDITTAVANATNSVNANNADTLDGFHATSFMRSDISATNTGSITTFQSNNGQTIIGSDGSGSIEIGKVGRTEAGTPFIDFHSSVGSQDFDVRLVASGGTTTTIGQGILNIIGSQLQFNGNTVWHKNNMGNGSGLDADTVDGKHANQIASTDDILLISMMLN
jgi:hypothetical protein